MRGKGKGEKDEHIFIYSFAVLDNNMDFNCEGSDEGFKQTNTLSDPIFLTIE